MDWMLAIPSYRRHLIVGQKTLRHAAECGIPRERIHLFVTPEEHAAYVHAVDPGLVGEILPLSTAQDIAATRNAIVDHFHTGKVVSMDDDLNGMLQLAGDRLVPIHDWAQLFDMGFALAEKNFANLWGVYPVTNHYFMRNKPRVGLALCLTGCHGQILRGRACERVSLPCKEDYERTLQHFMADGAVVRMEWVAMDTVVYKGPGGFNGVRTVEHSKFAVDELMRRFPGLVKGKRAKTGFPECRLVTPVGVGR